MDKSKKERLEIAVSELEQLLNLIQINLRPPLVRIHALSQLFQMDQIEGEQETKEAQRFIMQEAANALEFLEAIQPQLDRIKKDLKGES